MSREGRVPAQRERKKQRRAAAGWRADARGAAASSRIRVLRVLRAVPASFKTNKGAGAEAGKPETRKAAAVKESERLGGEEREECQTAKPAEELSAVRAAIKEYDRYKSL